ncbi:hypothetical protein ACSBL2_11945 [Pedobacter sp. AW31-3R]|uniref:hypothetical protein n=1 Tax=Pedobacter sp. AW31-3R TaxID=3445781 RepID=UPI003F9F03A4
MLSQNKLSIVLVITLSLASISSRAVQQTAAVQQVVSANGKKIDTAKALAQPPVALNNGQKIKSTSADHTIRVKLENSAGKASGPWYKDILPVITLVLGLVLKELIDSWSNIKRTKKIGKRWKTELQTLVKPLERQAEEIQKSIDHRTANPNEPPKMVSIASLECENFESLDKSELLEYINRYYLKDYQEAVSLAGQINLQLSIIKSNSLLLKDTFVKGLEEIGKRNDKLTVNFQELLHALYVYKNKLFNKGGMAALEGDKFKTLDYLYGTQVMPNQHNGKYDYRVLNNDYFAPMIKELDRLSADEDTHQMASSTRKCLDNVVGINMESLYLITNMGNLMRYFQQSKTDLEDLLGKLDLSRKIFRII